MGGYEGSDPIGPSSPLGRPYAKTAPGASGPEPGGGEPPDDAALLLAEARLLLAQAQELWSPDPPARVTSPPASRRPAPRRRVTVVGVTIAVAACAGLGLTAGGASGLVSARAAHPDYPAPHLADRPPTPAPVLPPPTTDPLSDAVPTAVSIPRLGSTAPVVQPVRVLTSGLEKGLLSAPDDYHDLGWFRASTGGLLIVDGHVGFRANPGPLTYLGQLQQGDTVVVSYGASSRSYRVAAVASILKGELPASYFSAAYDGWLMLITCDFDSPFHAGHFANNVYVLASPE